MLVRTNGWSLSTARRETSQWEVDGAYSVTDKENNLITTEIIARWPGKSSNDGGPEHPAIYHMLDVAAAAECLIREAILDPNEQQALALLTALHDLGKISDSFRDMLREGQRQAYR